MTEAKKTHKIRYVGLELLDYCNYKCPHCYVKDTYKAIMDLAHFNKFMDELSSMGCVWILLTGGEPLLHPQFIEMYKSAIQKGFKVTVFSNGYYLTEEILECLKNNPPELFEISIYGATEQSYDDYVGIDGAFKRIDKAINALIKANISVKLKTVVIPHTFLEFQAIKKYAEDKGVDFRYDGFIVPKIDGCTSPCYNYRLNPEQIFNLDSQRKGFLEAMKIKAKVHDITDNRLYSCDAALNSVFIDASCKMSICTFARHIFVDLTKDNMTIESGQQKLIEQINMKRDLNETDECYHCSKRPYCRYCPGQFLLENGNEYMPIHWRCKYASLVENSILES